MSQPVLLIAVPLGLAFLSVLLKKIQLPFLILGALLTTVFSCLLEMGDYIIGGYKPPYGINLVIDGYNFYFIIIINILFILLVLMNTEHVKDYATILLVSLAGLNGLLMTGDLFNLFVFMEIASISAFIILSMQKRPVKIFNYIVIASLGSSLYLFGIIILYAQFGTLNMAHMHTLISEGSLVPVVAYVMIFAGLAVEVKLFPFNGWVKGVLETAKGFTGPLIGALYAGVMLMVFGRVFGDVLQLTEPLTTIFTIIAVVTLITGEAMAFSSKRLRQVWLFSSIAQSGLAVLLFVNGLGHAAVLVVVANVLSKFVLFNFSGRLAGALKTDEISQLKGVFMKRKVFGIVYSVAAMSLIGLPLFFGFFVKINALLALFASGNLWVPALILVGALIESAYVIRLLIGLWQAGEEGEKPHTVETPDYGFELKAVSLITGLVIALALVFSGLYPDLIVDKTKEAGLELMSTEEVQVFTLEGGLE